MVGIGDNFAFCVISKSQLNWWKCNYTKMGSQVVMCVIISSIMPSSREPFSNMHQYHVLVTCIESL